MSSMTADELAGFYNLIGGAIWHIQYLEDALVNFLSMKLLHERRCASATVTLEDAHTLLSEKRRLTFGPLLESCASRTIIRPEHQPHFEAFKHERHWLVHRSMVETDDALYRDSSRYAGFARIDAVREESIRLKKLVVADLEAWSAAHGVDTPAAQRQAEAAVQKLKGA
jgi:hypothetical protein